MKNTDRKAEVTPRIYECTAILLFLFAGPLILFKPAYDYTLVKNITGYLLVILLSALFIIRKRNFVFEIKNLIIFLMFFSWILISSFTAPFGYGAARTLEDYILYLLIFICAANMDFDRNYLYIWLSAGFIASLTALVNFIGPRKYAISTFGNPNFFAGHAIMLLPIAFAMLFIKENTRIKRYILLFFVAIVFLSIIATRSRAAIFGSLFGVSTLMFLVNNKGMRKWGGYVTIFLAGILSYRQILRWIDTDIRWYLWRGALEMIKRRPFTGWGTGNFVFFYPFYRIREYFLRPQATPVTIHAHNEYLQILSENGIIGLLLFMGLAIIIIWGSKQKRENVPFESLLIKGCIAGIAAVLADNIFSTNLRNPSTAMYFWFLMGLSAGKLDKPREISFNISRALWYAIGTAGFVMCVFTSFYRIMPEVYLKRGIWARDAGDFKTSIDNYLIVCSLNPYNYEAWYKMAFAHGEAGNLEEARRIYLKINSSIFPHFAKTDANLGAVYLREGDYERSLYYCKWAEWFNPYDKDILCTISSIYLMFYNDVPHAVSYLNKVLTIDPKNDYANRIMNLLRAEGKT